MSLKKEYEELIAKEKQLDEQLKKWEDEGKKEMNLLHKYNEVKDATQIILAAIAEYEGVTVKKIHERFNLPLIDCFEIEQPFRDFISKVESFCFYNITSHGTAAV